MEYKTLPIDILTGYRRLFGFPIDKDSVYDDLEKAKVYAASSRSYDGQIISILEKVDETHIKVYPYIVENKELREFNSDYFTKFCYHTSIPPFFLNQEYIIKKRKSQIIRE